MQLAVENLPIIVHNNLFIFNFLQAVHRDESNEWVLKIRNAKVNDSGMYECQVSTQPVRSFFVHLRVGGLFLKISLRYL